MLCKTCYANRVSRDGGQFGLCWQHKKTKCRLCGELSGGSSLCIPCAHDEDVARWKAESSPIFFDSDHEYVQIQLRKEKLAESKYHIHRATEIVFRALVLVVEAIWGGFKENSDPSEIGGGGNPQIKKAA